MPNIFRDVITFFGDIGIYDVVLPFLLVFTIVFAIFEKTKILGTDEIEGTKYPKKNLNSMVAFVIAFLVVASSRLVAVINEAMANIVLLMLIVVSFLVLIGVFYSEDEEVILEGPWRTAFMGVLLVAILLIFLYALGWLQDIWEYIVNNWDSELVGSIFLLLIFIGFIAWVTADSPSKKAAKRAALKNDD
ncbi:hypothetical protein D6764_04355 [Candidatus Woesearchaeota archaeon]|nr:MAG: hypothetical protein D6764_04355 [Candidatus Woesearchaeota archaeon]